MPVILGIESTAHTFGIGFVKDGKILSNVKKTYTTEKGGIIPLEAAKHHEENWKSIYLESLEKAGMAPKGVPSHGVPGTRTSNEVPSVEENINTEGKIDAVAFSQGPGLAPCLLVGLRKAKELSKKLGVPLVPVNHCVAHLEIGKLTGAEDPVMLYASGANTQIIAYASGKYRIFGETLDLGVGNFIDTFGRYTGIGFPAGPKIQKLASGSKNYIELPYKVKGMDIALSGILTNLKQKLDSKSPRDYSSKDDPAGPSGEPNYKLNDLAYSLQETVFAMLVETAERALAHTGKKELLLGGGVACNSRLQEMCKIMCEERDAKFFCPEKQFLVDNASMIAYLGEIMFKAEIKESPRDDSSKDDPAGSSGEPKNLEKIDIKPRQRTDEVVVSWK